MALFKATKLQVLTYLLGVCPFSIAFLVFLNSTVSFVITDLIGKSRAQGDAVGNLGFADELLALIACPAWGLLSDRIGVRMVCVLGYFIIALAFILFVQAKNVYPQLLLGRLFFSIGGAAASTMVTAILPAVAAQAPVDDRLHTIHDDHENGNPREPPGNPGNPVNYITRDHADSTSSEVTITPARLQNHSQPPKADKPQNNSSQGLPVSGSSKVAGFVGLFTGIGALISLALFLPLPARFQKAGLSPGQALQDSYYVVAVIAFALCVWSFFGLSRISGEEEKGFSAIFRSWKTGSTRSESKVYVTPFWKRFLKAFVTGFWNPNVGLGYIGGLVARASSVGISLFIPLAINAQFRTAGLCNVETYDSPSGLPDIKHRCPRAYTLSAELTGVSQLIALLAAPLFGYLGSRVKRNVPLMVGAAAGIAGYIVFGVTAQGHRTTVNGTATDFVAMALIGISQIAAIVCSLGVLSDGILQQSETSPQQHLTGNDGQDGQDAADEESVEAINADEMTSLIHGNGAREERISDWKGSIAGVYSLYGGAGILILTKAGGALFDSLSFGSPFFIMAIFNAILLTSCAFTAIWPSAVLLLRR